MFKKILAIGCFGLSVIGLQPWFGIWTVGIALHMVAGIIALLFYDGKNFLRGPWDLAKTGILVAVLALGYLCFLAYLFGAREENTSSRS